MKASLYLLFLLSNVGIAQSKLAEDSVLQQRLEAGTIDTNKYRREAEALREAIGNQRGYPEIPVDSAGNFYLVTRLQNAFSREENYSATLQWLVRAGMTYDPGQAYLDPQSGTMLLRVMSPYVYSQAGKTLISTEEVWSAAPSEVSWLLEVQVSDGSIVIEWQDPLLREFRFESYAVFDGVGLSIQEVETLYEGLLPLVNHDRDEWEERLRKAKLIRDTLVSAEDNLRDHLTASLAN
ncbi:hypothetical protein [Lewinella sp. IMCC34191]|uniref:hypothetical protein n=1 Tax=Lewinella sp. IMCC34191 TaxID=2259172 RepID=UPI000E25AA95|nr:hypothetical protein [Lewinella sp. IMCC34191]